MKIFLTSTVHNDWNLEFNPMLTAVLEQHGFEVHMPQRDTNQKAPQPDRVRQNMEAIKNIDASIIVLENASMNLAAETGYTFGLGKPCVGLVKKGDFIPWMLRGMLNAIIEVDDFFKIDAYINQLVKTLQNFK